MSFATTASIVAIAAGAASLSAMGYQAAQGAPTLPNGAAASRDVANAQAASLPTQLQLSAMEQQGGKMNATPATMTRNDLEAKISALREQYKTGGKSDGAIAGQIATLKEILKAEPSAKGAKPSPLSPGGARAYDQFTVYQDGQGNYVPKSVGTADFTGYGTADIQSELARKMADVEANLGDKYGTQFAKEAAKEAEQANPLGTAARNKEYDLIQQHLNNPDPINPLSTSLQSGIDAQLKAGNGLDPMSRDLLDAAVAKANASRGGAVDPNAVATRMGEGAEGEARRQAGITKSQAFLNSGATPADIEYRREQQNLADLSSFVGGRTPESQFQSLSGAGQGAAPITPAQSQPQMPTNAAQVGTAGASAQFGAQTQQASQPNSWLAGISALLSAGSGAVGALRTQ